MLRPARDLRRDPDLGQLRRQDRDDLVDLRLALEAPLGHPALEVVVHLGMEGLERQVLELALDLRHTQPVRERRVDVQRLAADRALLLRGQVVERAHVVEPVGELDHQDPDVPGHGDQHLAEVLGLPLLAAGEGELPDLGDAVDQLGDVAPEALDQDGLAGRRVLEDVVEEPGRDRRGVHLELDEQAGDREGVDVVGLAGDPALAPVDLLGELVGPADDLDVPARLIAGDLDQEVAQRPHVRVPARPRGAGEGATRPGPGSGPTAPGGLASLPPGRGLHHGLFGAPAGAAGSTFPSPG